MFNEPLLCAAIYFLINFFLRINNTNIKRTKIIVNILNNLILKHKSNPDIVEIQSEELFVSYLRLTIMFTISNAKNKVPKTIIISNAE